MKRGRRTVGWVLFAGAILAAATSFFLVTRRGPDEVRLLAQEALSELLEGEVKLAPVQISLTDDLPWVRLTTFDARLRRDDLNLEVQRVEAQLDPISLALGQIALRGLEFGGARLTFTPQPEDDPEPETASRWVARGRAVTAWLREHPCILPDTTVSNVSIRVRREDQTHELARDLQGSLDCVPVVQRAKAHVSGKGGPAFGRLDASYDASPTESKISIDVDSIPIDWLSERIGLDPGLRGDLAGSLSLGAKRTGPLELETDLHGRKVRGWPGRGHQTPDLSLERPRLRGKLLASESKLELEDLRVRDGNAHARFTAALGLPVTARSSVSAQLRFLDQDVAGLLHVAAQFPPATRGLIERSLAPVESGTVHRLEIDLDSRFDRWQQIVERGPLSHAGDVQADVSVSDVTWALNEHDRIEDLEGSARYEGDRLELHDVSGRFPDGELEMQATVAGLANVHDPDELNCVRPRRVPELRGFPALQAFLSQGETDEAPDATPAVEGVALDLDWLAHPSLMCSLENVRARIDPVAGGVTVALEHGVYAGLPVRADGSYVVSESGGAQLVFNATVGPPFEGMAPEAPSKQWARGKVTVETQGIAGIALQALSGDVAAEAATLTFDPIHATLAPAGDVSGRLVVDLTDDGPPGFEVALQAPALDLADFWQAIGDGEGLSTGTVHGAFGMKGRLAAGESLFAGANGAVSLHVRDGKLRQHMPLLLAIASASDKYNPVRDSSSIPFDAIDAVAKLVDGVFDFTNMTLAGPALRVAGTGTIQGTEPNRIDLVLGLFFLPRVDDMIDKLPLIRTIVLGRNRNLVGAYFVIDGVLGEPHAHLTPVKSLAEGLPGTLLRSVPGLLLDGGKRIQSLLMGEAEMLPPAEGATN